jgi:hypothetical protein
MKLAPERYGPLEPGDNVAMRSMLLSPACWGVPEYPKFNFIQRGRRFGHPGPLDMFG